MFRRALRIAVRGGMVASIMANEKSRSATAVRGNSANAFAGRTLG